MSDLRSKVAYLRGLSDGLELDTNSKEGRMISELLGVVGELADNLSTLESGHEELETYVDVIDTDLQDLEEEIFGDDEDGVELETAAGEALPAGEPLGSGSLIDDCYVCPVCGEHVSIEHAVEDDGLTSSEGTILTRLVCPECGTVFHATEPGTVTYVDSEDELTDLPYPTKE